MNAIEYIKREAASVRQSTDRVMNDVTDELFDWALPAQRTRSVPPLFIF